MSTIANADKTAIIKAFVWFFLSTVFTWLFIVKSPLYFSQQQQLLSCAIAGGKWGIQILLALLFIRTKKWQFLERIGFTCFVGSVILLPYYVSSVAGIGNSPYFFLGSLVVAVLAMIVLYYKSVLQLSIGLKWWFFWLVCLAIAISLQLTIVFHVIG